MISPRVAAEVERASARCRPAGRRAPRPCSTPRRRLPRARRRCRPIRPARRRPRARAPARGCPIRRPASACARRAQASVERRADRVALVRHASRIRRGPRRRARSPRRPRSAPAARRRARSCRARPASVASADPSAATRTREVCQGGRARPGRGRPRRASTTSGPCAPERRQRAGRAAQLHAPARSRASSTSFCASSTPTSQVAALSPNVVGSACWSSVRATMGVARWRLGERRAGRRHPRDVGQHELERPPADEHRGRVHDVLAGRAVVHVAGGVAADGGAQRAHERLGRDCPTPRPSTRDAVAVEAARRDRRRRSPRQPRPGSRPTAASACASARSLSSIACSQARSPSSSSSACGAKIASNTVRPARVRRSSRPAPSRPLARRRRCAAARAAASARTGRRRASGAASRSSTRRSARRARRAAGRSPSRRRAAACCPSRASSRAPRPGCARPRSRG